MAGGEGFGGLLGPGGWGGGWGGWGVGGVGLSCWEVLRESLGGCGAAGNCTRREIDERADRFLSAPFTGKDLEFQSGTPEKWLVDMNPRINEGFPTMQGEHPEN